MKTRGYLEGCDWQVFRNFGAFSELAVAIQGLGETSKQPQYWQALWKDRQTGMREQFERYHGGAVILQVKNGAADLKTMSWNSLYLASDQSNQPIFCGSDIDANYLAKAKCRDRELISLINAMLPSFDYAASCSRSTA
jgi:hypothetical protein